ncbi:MAG: hypothetical protein KatS3mg111_0507 [Pirellulaceae bacterium]|nr:MAG: hypothetical protein KatS3mg111_0507 [Pirellulaceae bacterium]
MLINSSWAYLLMYIPLLAAVSFTIGATRHERRELILDQAVRTAVWITSFMLVIYAVLQILSWMV